MKEKFHRHRLLVEPGFQLRLLLRMGCYFLFYAVFVWHIGFLVQLMSAFAEGNLTDGIAALYADYFWQQRSLIYAMILTLPIFMGDMLQFSNRLSGPLFRCQKFMNDMAEGKAVPDFKPRQGDFIPDFFAAFNRLVKIWNANNPSTAVSDVQRTPVEAIVDKSKVEELNGKVDLAKAH